MPHCNSPKKRKAILSLATLLAAQLAHGGSAVLAADNPASPSQVPLDLDLSSKAPGLTAGNLLKSGAVNIKVGNAVQTVTGATMLTPAELMASYQVATTGAQSLQLGSSGNAVAGTVNIGAQFSSAGNIVIPQGVTAISNAALAPLILSGNLSNFGTLLAISTNPAVTTATINAANIFNNPGALLSTVLPQGGLPGYSNLVPNLNLSLHALNSIINSGTISSSGDLSLLAGGAITNSAASLARAGAGSASGSAAQLTAAQNINLLSGSGLLFNSGLIQAQNSINISAPVGSNNLQISNTGVIEAIGYAAPGTAAAGVINVRESGYSGNGLIELLGGDWHAGQINLNGGDGQVEVAVQKLEGKLNLQAGVTHVLADTPLLTLGNCTVEGDPTYVNIGGAIEISGTLTESAPLAIIAKTNVVAASNAAKIVNHGNPVWIIAGGSIDTTNGAATGFANTGSQTLVGGELTGGFVQVTAAGGAGGNIDFSASTIASGETAIDTSSTIADSAGGDVHLIAVGNAGTGRVIFPATAGVSGVNSSGNAKGANGSVEIVSGAASGSSFINGITNNGGTGAAGNISIQAGQVTFSGGDGSCANCISFDQTGVATGSVSSISPTNSTVVIDGQLSSNGSLKVAAGGITVNPGSVVSVADSVELSTNTGSNGSITINSALTGAGVDLATDGTGIVTVGASGSVSSKSGDIDIVSRGVVLNGPVSSGSGLFDVTIKPNDLTKSIGINGGTGTMQITGLAQITADTVTIGAKTATGSIRVNAAAGTLTVDYNLEFLSASAAVTGFANNGSIIMGGKTFTADFASTSVNLGNITAGSANVNANGIQINGSINLSDSSPAVFHAKSDIFGSGVINAESLILTADKGYIKGFDTGAKTIVANAGTEILLQNSLELSSITSAKSSSFGLTNAAGITIGPSGINSAGSVFISNNGAISVGASGINSGGNLTISSDGPLTIGPSSITTAGYVDIKSDGAISIGASGIDAGDYVTIYSSNDSITVGKNGVVAVDTVYITANGSNLTVEDLVASDTVRLTTGGDLTLGGLFVSNNTSIELSASKLILMAPLSVGTSTVTITPVYKTLSIGINGGAGTFQLDLDQITAETIIIGSSSGTGAIDFGKTGATSNISSNLSILASTAATFKNNGTIDLGNKNLTVNVGGNIDLGTVETSGEVIFNTLGDVTLSSSNNLNLGVSTAENLTINSSGVIGAAGSITAEGDLNLVARGFSSADGVTVAGNFITLQGLPVDAFTVSNQGKLLAGQGDISITSAPGKDLILGVAGKTGILEVDGYLRTITLTATGGGSANLIDVVGDLTLNGISIFNAEALTQAATIGTGVNVTGSKTIFVQTQTLNLDGSITGDLVVGAKGLGTIANSNPNVALDLKNLNGGSFEFQGKVLTILSAGSIINTATTSSINLSGTKDVQGGTLNLIAGFNFTGPQSSASLPPNAGVFQLDGTSNAGKNIDLGKTSINVSGVTYAGSVLAVATGSIKLGPINTTASEVTSNGGVQGSVTVIGNGITLGAINASAAMGTGASSISIISGTASISGGPMVISKGIVGAGTFTASNFNGNIKVSQIVGALGEVTITTGGSGVISQFAGTTINTQGLVTITSGAKGYTLKTTAFNLSLNTDPNAFTANVSVTSDRVLTLHDSTVGGNLTVVSSPILPLSFSPELEVAKNATVATGGNLVFKTPNGTILVGSGATVTAGKLNGSEAPSPAPILKDNILHAGSISFLSTNSGGTITVENGAAVISNGGNININVSANSGGHPEIDGLLQANGGSILLSSAFGISLGSAQLRARSLGTSAGNITMSPRNGGIAIGNNSLLQADKTITLAPSLFGFAIGNAVTITAGMSGSGALSLTSSGSQLGSGFSIGKNSHLESNKAALTISSKTAIFVGEGTTITSKGASLTINSLKNIELGTSSAGVILSATKSGSAGGAVNLSSLSGISFGKNSAVSADAAIKLMVNNNSLSSGGIVIGEGSQLSGIGNVLKLANSGIVTIQKNVVIDNVGAFTISTPKGSITIGSADIEASGNIKMNTSGGVSMTGTSISPTGSLTLSATAGEIKLDAAKVSSDSLSMTALSDIWITNAAQITSAKSITGSSSQKTANLHIGDGVQIDAGAFSKAPLPDQPFAPSLITSRGSIIFSTGENVFIGDNIDWSTVGGNITVTAKAGLMQIGNKNSSGTNNQFLANGGNIIMLAKGTVTGANGNHFHAIGMGTSSSNNVGGGIEIASGRISSSKLTTALNMKGTPISPPAGSLGSGVLFNNNINGVIQAFNKSGNANAINLNTGTTASQLLLNGTVPTGARGGAQVFDAAASGAGINFDNATFQTEALKPIAMSSYVGLELEFDPKTFDGQLFVKQKSRLQQITNRTLRLHEGEVFLTASTPVRVLIDSAEVQAEKDALVSIRSTGSSSYIRSLSKAGTINVDVQGKTIQLNPGEELLLTHHRPEQLDINPQDGLGRRHSHTSAIGNVYATISDFAIITLLTASEPVSDLCKTQDNKRIVGKILKTAATIDVALKHRGPYTATLK